MSNANLVQPTREAGGEQSRCAGRRARPRRKGVRRAAAEALRERPPLRRRSQAVEFWLSLIKVAALVLVVMAFDYPAGDLHDRLSSDGGERAQAGQWAMIRAANEVQS